MTKMCYFCCNYTNDSKDRDRGFCSAHKVIVNFGDECGEFKDAKPKIEEDNESDISTTNKDLLNRIELLEETVKKLIKFFDGIKDDIGSIRYQSFEKECMDAKRRRR